VQVNSEKGMYSIVLPKSQKGTHKRIHCIIIEREDIKIVYEYYDKIF